MENIIFSVREDESGGFIAKSKLEKGSITTQGDTIKELKNMILDAVAGYFHDNKNKPRKIILKFEEEVLEFA